MKRVSVIIYFEPPRDSGYIVIEYNFHSLF